MQLAELLAVMTLTATDRVDVQEAVVRGLLRAEFEQMAAYTESFCLGRAPAGLERYGLRPVKDEHEPEQALLARFASGGPEVVPLSACLVEIQARVPIRYRNTNERALIIRVGEPKVTSEGEVEVAARAY